MKKKIICIAISALVSLFAIVPAFAQSEIKDILVNNVSVPVSVEHYDLEEQILLSNTIMPRFTYIKQVGAGLRIQNKVAHIYAECITYNRANISIKVELQRKENGTWKTIKTFSGSANDEECVVSEEYTVTSGYDYRTNVSATANGESTSKTSSIQYCN